MKNQTSASPGAGLRSRTAVVSEIYASLQGEGPHAGERQVFLRLAGCPLRCHYCDTPASLTAQGHASFSVDDIVREVRAAAAPDNVRTVSVTGGEPLAQVPALEEILPALRAAGFRVYLETAGVHPDALQRVIDFCDVVSMDLKLPSAVGRAFWEEHRAFLRIARPKVFAKMVVASNSTLGEIAAGVDLLAERPSPLLVLQPASPVPGADAPSPGLIADAAALARARLPRVLIQPQLHKIWNVR